MRWWSPSTAPTAPEARPVPLARRCQGAVRRPARRRLLPGPDLPELRPALLREVLSRTWNSSEVPKNQLRGLRARQRQPRTTTARTTPSGRHRPPRSGTRLVLTNRLLEEADGGPTARSTRWPRAWFCRQCGAMHRDPSTRCLADGCGHKEPLLPLIAFGSTCRPAPRAARRRSRSAAGRSSRPGRSRPSRSPTFTSWPRR